jgi:hypothetical protein
MSIDHNGHVWGMDIPWVLTHTETCPGYLTGFLLGHPTDGPVEGNQTRQAHSEPTKANARVKRYGSTSISGRTVAITRQAKPPAVTRTDE